ncbi:MAG: ThiF family adenylyltransferase [Betaproteobacteria bacterium]|nr:ThiF family adenylyltransferase [Betaproteobacteria bacterium]
MSHRLIGLNPDLEKLRNEGYDLAIRGGFLVILDVPHVTSNGGIARGTLISALKLSGERTDKPDTHVCYWQGEMPCHSSGQPIRAIENPSARQDLGHGLTNVLTFSAKADYRDYHHKMTTYLGRIVGEAKKLDPTVTAQTFPVFPIDNEAESVFKYVDTASSRAGIGALNEKFATQRIAIVGLGGTGAYILDLVAKTQVREIHLFDGDRFFSHNAFRSPGAASLDTLRGKPTKVAYLTQLYEAMRRGIHPHPEFMTAANVEQLRGFDFVFLCIDGGTVKADIIAALDAFGITFIDVGLGVTRGDNGLSGLLRVTTSTPTTREQARRRIPLGEDDGQDNEYKTNVQIAELNALNATLAVIRWKKLAGFYRDSGREHNTSYAIAPNALVGEDVA